MTQNKIQKLESKLLKPYLKTQHFSLVPLTASGIKQPQQ